MEGWPRRACGRALEGRLAFVAKSTKRSAVAGRTESASDRRDAGPKRLSHEERAASGKAARAKAPLEAHADFRPARSRDPVALLLRQAETRVPDLVPIRHGRMLVSPFTFYRGAALLMAADLHTTPSAGLRTQLCGDAHFPTSVPTLRQSVAWCSTSTTSTRHCLAHLNGMSSGLPLASLSLDGTTVSQRRTTAK
jgi:Uncharacterized protein conserved in bacteria (DUF2252)